ncbi:V-type proton ATPase subunit H-like [Orbicella faveolata]|uniref:V-type proton ATPase subunit H-like n=1 Tax=Orbicella faveolata TaxID=48498 RepID=UPI0009E4CF3C|nr:V-type proton ATPase subunit H-like [Orbicella faveolata]XP_020630992.1 V-type proton ATPase subunit H-like [Orbicella faveolata]
MSSYQSLADIASSRGDGVDDPNLSSAIVMPFGRLSVESEEVRKQKVNWQSYVQSQMINQEDYTMIADYDCMGVEERGKILEQKGDQFVKSCLSLLARLSRDHTIRYILVLIDDVLTEDRSRVSIFHNFGKRASINVWASFLKLLNRQDQFMVHQTAIIIAKLASWGKVSLSESDLNYFLTWVKNGLASTANDYQHSVAQCLQLMLRHHSCRQAYFKMDGIQSVVSALVAPNIGFQLQYQLIFVLWLLSFDPRIAQRMTGSNAVVRVLADILRESGKEKVTRIIIATLRNLLEKPEEKKNEAALSMVQCKLLPVLSVLNGKTWVDEDIRDDVEVVYEKLNERVQDLSTFDEYAAEVRSGRLEWSPVHKSEKFWRENAQRLNEKNYELLKILTKLLEKSADPTILAVAAHDTGEYVRHYPRGKHVLENLGCKVTVMKMMTHNDPNVRKEALLAVQKLMVHNWEYLGKQLKAS